MKIMFSIPYAPTFQVPEGDYGNHHITCVKRASDWGKRGVQKKFLHVVEAWRVARAARNFDALVLCTVGIEAFFVARFRPLLCPRTHLAIADILMPQESRLLHRVKLWLKRIDTFACIRTGDVATLGERFNIPASKCFYVPFPANGDLKIEQSNPDEEPYIYSAGSAHRDWETLINALKELPYRAILSPGVSFKFPSDLPERIQIIPPQPPKAGRELMAKAHLAVFSLKDTKLPSGPLVLLDAMAMGKPIVTSLVNGTKDYVVDSETALTVPPKDPQAMATAIRRLMEDPILARKIGQAAHDATEREFTNAAFIEILINSCVSSSIESSSRIKTAR